MPTMITCSTTHGIAPQYMAELLISLGAMLRR